MSKQDLTLYVVICRYKNRELIPQHYEAHVRWADKHSAAGNLLLAGAAASQTEGVLLARASSIAHVEEIVRDDPFYVAGLVDFEITAFTPRRGSLRDNPENPLFLDATARQTAFSSASGLPQSADPQAR